MKKSELKQLIRNIVKEQRVHISEIETGDPKDCVSCTTHEDCGALEICMKEAGSDANTIGCCEVESAMGPKIKTVRFATKQG